MNKFNKILSAGYSILAMLWTAYGSFIFFTNTENKIGQIHLIIMFGITISMTLLLISFIHWKVSNTITGILREKLFTIFSLINVSLLYFSFTVFMLFSSLQDKGYGIVLFFMMLPLLFSNALTLIFGIANIVKISKTILWILSLIIILPPIAFILLDMAVTYLRVNYYI